MKIKAACETETYIGENDYYTIEQKTPFLDSNGIRIDAVVQLTPDQMRLLIADMEIHLETADDWFRASE